LQGTAALLGVAESVPASPLEIGKVEMVSKDVYFHEGDLLAKGHCNNGWVIFEDYVLVIDANFPSGAQDVLPKIRALTAKPIRFAFDTHHHGDHAYGNQVWVENGAAPVAHTGVIEEMKRYETGYYGNTPGRWEESAKTRADVKASRLKPPSVLFPRELIFDDGTHRVELLHLGVAHTHGDAFAWLPKERILFAGDACVNGPFNYVGDGNIEQWVKTLDSVRKLGTRTVCPGHGPRGPETVLEDQQAFFQALRTRVGALVSAKKTPEEVRVSVDQIRAQLSSDPKIARYVGQDGIAAQVEKVFTELTGQAFPAARRSLQEARAHHARDHGLQLLESHSA
jgi:glyoxylase-like metal-dependent hydrolase (beta-lactamase superfamily II)